MIIGVNSRIYLRYKTGISYYIFNLYSKLLQIDQKNQYIFFQTSTGEKIGETKLINLPKNNLNDALFDSFLVNKLIKKEKIDLFHGPANVLPFHKVKGVRYLVTIHDLAFLKFPEHYPLSFRLYYQFHLKRTLNNADLIITDSFNTRNDIREYFRISEKKIKVVHLGVGESFFKETKKRRLIKEKYFFSVSTHQKRKNILSILETMRKSEELQQYKYVISGLIPPDQREALNKKIDDLKLNEKVKIIGFVPEEQLINLYQNAEFFIYPSLYEGFGLPVLEAMACRCPVITSNNSSLVEITPEKKWLVDPHSLEDISDKMERMICLSSKERTGLIQRNFVFSQKFTWEKTAKKMITIFNSL